MVHWSKKHYNTHCVPCLRTKSMSWYSAVPIFLPFAQPLNAWSVHTFWLSTAAPPLHAAPIQYWIPKALFTPQNTYMSQDSSRSGAAAMHPPLARSPANYLATQSSLAKLCLDKGVLCQITKLRSMKTVRQLQRHL